MAPTGYVFPNSHIHIQRISTKGGNYIAGIVTGCRQGISRSTAVAARARLVTDVSSTDVNHAATSIVARNGPSKQPAQHEHQSKSKSWLHSRFDEEIFQLALPAALALAADPLLGMVDTALVGKLGADELAALGINTSLFSLAFVVFNFLATATTPMVAAAVSANNSRAAGETVWQATALATVLGVAVAAGLANNGSWCLQMMGADSSQQHLQELGLMYLHYRAFAAPAVLLTTVGQGVFRGIKNMRAPLLITLATNALHLGLDMVLMFRLGLGIQGAAISTAASEWLSAGAYGWLIWQRRELLGLWPPPRAHWHELKARCAPFLQAGSAVIMRTGSLLGTKTLATAVAARLGPGSVASHQVLMQLWVLSSMLVDSLAVSGQTLIAVHIGQNQPSTARQVSERLLQLGLGLGLLLSVVLGLGSPWWPQLFTADEGVLGQIKELVPLAVLPLPVNALVYTLDGVLVGASDFRYLMTAMVGASAVATSLLMMVEPWGAGLEGVWAALAVLMVARLLTLGWRYQSQDGPVPPAIVSGEDSGTSTRSSTAAAQGAALEGRDGEKWQQQQQHYGGKLQQHLCETFASRQQPEGQLAEQQVPEAGSGVEAQDSTATSRSSGDAGAHMLLLNNSLPGNSKLQAHRKHLRHAPPAPGRVKYRKVHNGFKQAAAGLYNRGIIGTSESATETTAAVTETTAAKLEPRQ